MAVKYDNWVATVPQIPYVNRPGQTELEIDFSYSYDCGQVETD